MMMTIFARPFAILAASLALAAPSASRAADTYKADPVHSSVVYRAKHMNTSYAWGRFNDLSGTFSLDPADPAGFKLQFQVKADSIDTGNAKRDQHLKGPDFFNVVQYPTISFTSKSIVKAASGNAHTVSGNLTLHGVTKPITVLLTPVGKGKDMKGTPIAGIEASFTVSQKEFGISKMAAAIGDEVWVIVSVEGVKQ